MVAHVLLHFLHIRVVLELEEFLLERDRVVKDELGGVFEYPWDSVLAEIPGEGTRDIGEHEGNILGEGFREESGQSGQCIVATDSNALNTAIGEEKNGGNGIYMLLDLGRDTIFVAFVLLSTTCIGQSRGVEDADLGKWSPIPVMFQNTVTYHYSILACKFVKAGGVGLTLIIRTYLFIAAVEDF